MGSVGSAEVLYEWNDLAGAAQASSVSTDLLRASVERLLLVRGYVVLALVCQARGDHAGALDALWRCDAWFTQTQMEALVARAWLAAYQARLWVRQGELTAAARWAQTCAFAGDSELGYVQQLTLVQLHLAQSHNGSGGQLLDEANAILAQLIPTVEARGWSRYLIEGLALQALAYQAQGNRTNAMTTLERALSLAEPECYIRTFVDHSTPMAALLTHIARGESPVAAYAATLLSHFGFSIFDCGLEVASPIASPKAKTQNLVEPLSERELDVLRLIADGHSNQAIADTLVVAVSTVKRHINNIYGKLGVQSRTQALVRARDLSLLW
jgi:LuxR family maltose regulon positive regulatory protein